MLEPIGAVWNVEWACTAGACGCALAAVLPTSCGKALPGLDCELGLAAIAGPGGLRQAAARSGKGFAWAAR